MLMFQTFRNDQQKELFIVMTCLLVPLFRIRDGLIHLCSNEYDQLYYIVHTIQGKEKKPQKLSFGLT